MKRKPCNAEQDADQDEEESHSLVEEPLYEEPPTYLNDVESTYEEIREVSESVVDTEISDEGLILRTMQPLQAFPARSRVRLPTPNYDSDSSGSFDSSETDEPQPPAISPTYENVSWKIGEVAGNEHYINQSHDPPPCTGASASHSRENDSQYKRDELEEVDESPFNTDDPPPCTSNVTKDDGHYDRYKREEKPFNADDAKTYDRQQKRHYEVSDQGLPVGDDVNSKRSPFLPKTPKRYRKDKEVWNLGGPAHAKSSAAWVRHCQVNLQVYNLLLNIFDS